jgi:hypothetical protein
MCILWPLTAELLRNVVVRKLEDADNLYVTAWQVFAEGDQSINRIWTNISTNH